MKFILLCEKEDIEKSLTMFLSQYTKLEDLEFVLKSIREFPGSLLKLSQEYFDSLDRQIQLVIMRKVIDEIGMENVRFVHAYNYFKKTLTTEPLTFYSLVSAYLTTGGEIFITHPFKIKLYWNEKLARLFGCDCAEHVLHNFENVYPNDDSLRRAIFFARLFALDLVSWGKLYHVLDECKRNAKLKNPSWSAAYSAANNDITGAVWNAMLATTNYDVTWNPAKNIEFDWQFKKLLEYLLGEKTVETARQLYIK